MQTSKKNILILSVLFLFIMAGAADAVLALDSKTSKLINCDIQNQACIQMISGAQVSFDIQPKPVKAMEDLTFIIAVNDMALDGLPIIELKMPAMKMGKNQVQMKEIAPGVYQGTGIIVRCPSGKTVWQAVVELPGKGSVDFIFDVVY
ncbi:MAG: hypothetical protein PF503_08710 [Desulfobacula sp.]|jgi:hypothetical protein|nr:hypothetical protein [Desulfobacula sp.]